MGRLVNVVLPSGRVVAVDEEVAKASQLSQDAGAQLGQQAANDLNAERSSGVVEGLKAAGEGALDTVSFGLYGATRAHLDPEAGRTSAIRAEERSGSRFVGELAGMALPGLGEAGVLGKAGGAAARLTAPGIARGVGELAGEVGGKWAARAAEGAILGTGGYVSSTNVTGDPLTIEAAVENAGLGAIIETGMGFAADRFEGAAWSSKIKNAKNEILQGDLETAGKGAKLFKDPPPSWNELVESHEAAKASTREFNSEVAREAKRYEDFVGNNYKLTKAISETQDVLNNVRNDVYARQGGPFGGTPERVKYNLDSSGNARQVEYTYEGGAKAKAGFEGEGQQVIKGPAGESVNAQGTPALKSMQYKVDPRQPISDATLERLKGYSQRISRILQKKAGGWKMDAGKWIPDPAAVADPAGALEDLRVLQSEIKQRYSLGSGVMKEQLPIPPRTPLPDVTGEIPKSLETFARKHAGQINEIAQQLDPASAGALSRVMKDLDLSITGDSAQDLTALHETLRGYRGKIEELTAQAEKKAAEEAKKPLMLKILNRAGRYAVSRAFDVGGAMGAITRTLAGEAAGKVMTGVEDTVLGGALLEARSGLRQRIGNLVSKYGAGAADLTRKIAPPTAFLSRSFPSGQTDPERDPRKLAINRINEIHAAAMTAPDTAFMAVQGLLGHPSDIGWKLHQHVVGALNYLVSTLPRDPGTNTMMFTSNWTPQWHEAMALAHRLEAVQDPVTAIARAIAGDSHPAATEALWAVYPSIMNELAQELSIASPSLQKLTYEQASAYSNLFRTPLTGLQQPVVVSAIQGNYMNATAPQPGPTGGAKPKQSVGRPPAVNSTVAGSSVSSLIQ